MVEPPLLTLGDIARECDTSKHQAKYAIDRYGIDPRQRAGILRLWSAEDLPRIKAALALIARRKEVAHV